MEEASKPASYAPSKNDFLLQLQETKMHIEQTSRSLIDNSSSEKQELQSNSNSALYSDNMNAPTREELNAKLESVEAKMDGKIAAIQSSLELKLTELRGEVAHSTEVLRAEMHKGNTELIKWIVGAALTSMAVFVTVMTFVLNNAVPKQEKAAQQPAPIVIQVPSNIPPPAVPAQK